MKQRVAAPLLRTSLLAAALAAAQCAAQTGMPPAPLAFTIKGLEKPAEVLVDRWGVPHMYAGTTYDAFVVQGFIGVRDDSHWSGVTVIDRGSQAPARMTGTTQ